MSDFLAEVRRLEWEPTEGLWAPAIVEHGDTRIDFAGANYAPFDEIINGYTIQFSGVATRVDLLGSNNNLVDILIDTGVSVVPSNSAGLQIVATGSGLSAAQSLQLAEVHGQMRRGVFINNEELTNGNGYQQTPYNNFTDAVDDAEANGLQTLFIEADATVDRQLKNFEIIGIGGLPQLDLNGQIMDGSTLRLLSITGTQGDSGTTMIAFDCQLTNVVDFNGAASLVGGVGTIAFRNGGSALLNELIPFQAGTAVTLDMTLGGAAAVVAIQNASGRFLVKNMDHADDVMNIITAQGVVELDSTCTAGTVIICGGAQLIDNSGVGCTVQDASLYQELTFAHIMENGESFEEQTRLMRAASAGTIVQQADGSYVIKSADGTIDRITGDDSANSGRAISAVNPA
jgi:hypothetical protein